MVESNIAWGSVVKIAKAKQASETIAKIDSQSQVFADANTLVLVSAAVLRCFASLVGHVVSFRVSFPSRLL